MKDLTESLVLVRTEESRMLHQIVQRAYACRASLAELVDFALGYVNKDLNVVTQKMCTTLKVFLSLRPLNTVIHGGLFFAVNLLIFSLTIML